jgi:hypothetical protein
MKNILYQESIVEIKHLFRMMRNTLLALFVFAGTAFATTLLMPRRQYLLLPNHYERMIWQRKKTSYNKRYRYH